MRHRRDVSKFGRTSSHRKAMWRNMLNSLIEHEAVTTTETKAKELRRHADRIVSLGKAGVADTGVVEHTQRRRAYDRLRSRASVSKLFDTLAPRYAEREGGYTRIIKLGFRKGDNAPLARVEFVEEELPRRGKKKRSAPKKTQAAASKPSTKKEEAEEAKVEAAAEEAAAATEETAVEAAPAAEQAEATEAPAAEASAEEAPAEEEKKPE